MRRYEKPRKQLAEIQFQRQAAEMNERAAPRAKAVRPPERTGRLVPVVRNSTDISFKRPKVRPEESFGSLSAAEKAKVLSGSQPKTTKPGIK
jgi:hypothetical protein